MEEEVLPFYVRAVGLHALGDEPVEGAWVSIIG